MARAPKSKTLPPPSADLLELDLIPPDDPTADDNIEDRDANIVIPEMLPLVPIRDNVYFPHMLFPLFIGRDRSVRAVEAASDSNTRYILLAAQRQP